MTEKDISKFCITPNQSIREALRQIDSNVSGIVLITDETLSLLGTITDGDIRRAILLGDDLDTPVSKILERKTNSPYPTPVTAPANIKRSTLLRIMRDRFVRQIPLVNEKGQIVDLISWKDLLLAEKLPIQAVIMAGGFGSRLRPFTEVIPKPMLPVGGQPLLERIIEQLYQAGIRDITITTHFKPEKITSYFGDGRGFGVKIKYIQEEEPLGTGGALGLIPPSDQKILIINGDVLTQVDYHILLDFHNKNQSELTLGVRNYDIQIPYGVVNCEGPQIVSLTEKPYINSLVNAGIYLLEPAVQDFISDKRGQHFNMTDVVNWLLEAKRPVFCFTIHDYWLDIGKQTDFFQAQKDISDLM